MRLAFIGAGRQAQEHARCAVACGAEIVKAYTRRPDSPNRAAFHKVAPNVEWVRHLSEAFDGVDGIVCAVPWQMMPGLAHWLSATDKRVLLEKPIAFTVSDATRMIGAASYNHKGKAIGFNRRFYEPVQEFKDRIEKGGLVSAAVTISNHLDLLTARHGAEIKTHVHAVMSIHSIDLMLHLFGHCAVEHRSHPLYSLRSYTRLTPIVLALHDNYPMKAGISALFDDGMAYNLTPLECLTVYDGVDMAEATPDMPVRQYVSHETSRTIASTTYKPGIYAQMKAWLEDDWSTLARPTDAVEALSLLTDLRG